MLPGRRYRSMSPAGRQSLQFYNDYDHDLEKVDEAVKILGKTDKCCFCDYKCRTPTEQEEKDCESGFGVLDSLWDHIEEAHALAYEWLS